MTYNKAMDAIINALKCHGYNTSSPDLKIRWASKFMQDGSIITFWFKPQSIYYTRNNQKVRHFKDARSLHLENIKGLSVQKASYILDYLESRTI